MNTMRKVVKWFERNNVDMRGFPQPVSHPSHMGPDPSSSFWIILVVLALVIGSLLFLLGPPQG